MAVVGNLVQQLGVCGERDVLLLHGGVYESRLLLVALAPTAVLSVPPVILLLLPVLDDKIDADALLEDKLSTPSSPIRWRKCTSSDEAQGADVLKASRPQKYW